MKSASLAEPAPTADAPEWFRSAIARAPAVSRVPVLGADIEMLTWGERGKPGLLLLHGATAHARWWSPIAPFFADDYRIAATSWTGMGYSGWRPKYGFDTWVAEVQAAIDAAGLAEAGPPIIVAHSFGSNSAIRYCVQNPGKAAGLILVDGGLRLPGDASHRIPAPRKRHTLRPSIEDSLRYFRLIPPVYRADPWMMDFLGRTSLTPDTDENGVPGWRWSYDPELWASLSVDTELDVRAVTRTPLAVVWGDHSDVIPPEIRARTRAVLPDAWIVEIPDAGHHIMVERPLALVATLRTILAGWALPAKPR
jgi:pimeloyl-ACP methyl ester carboxylesterase